MNPMLRPILVFLSGAVLLLYIGTFLWFAWTALFGSGEQIDVVTAGPLEGPANEAVAYVWTTVSLLVGGVVAVAFGQPTPKPLTESVPTEKIVVAYAWAFMGVGILAIFVWIAAGQGTGASLLIKNAAVAFFGLAVPILTAFIRLPAGQAGAAPSFFRDRPLSGRFDLCADFSLFPDDTPMPASFDLAGFRFEEAGAAAGWVINVSGRERGLQFRPTGGRVRLPTLVSEVDLRLGAFAGDIELEAEDAAGNVVGTSSVAGTNTWSDTRLQAPEIAAVLFRKGGGEGALRRVCISVGMQPGAADDSG